MADAAIGASTQVVLETVLSLANDRIGQVLGFKEKLQRLSKTAKRIRGLLTDADDKKHSSVVQDWLKDLEGEAFKAENVLDEVNYENLRWEVKYPSQLKRKVCCFFSFFSTIGFRSRMASKLRDINMNLERINREASEVGLVFRYQIEAALPVPASGRATTCRQTDSVVVPNVVGRAYDESKIVEMLLSPSDKVISVIAIFGAPGLGKTTLAKSVYNNPQIYEHFDDKGEKENRIWVCVAKKITIVELFKLILESLRKEKVLLDNREAIIQNIKNELEGQRYFLVLDDVWNDERGLWNDFFTTLEGLSVANGSWCLVTTRIKEVSYTMFRHLKINVLPYKLEKLTNDDCWSIVEGKAIAAKEIPTEIKEQILNRCGGLPLAATLFGGLLTDDKEKWPSIVQRSLLDETEDGVEHILKVSFNHLSPVSVKKCFAYCSIFPRDTGMKKDLLIELWMAEGFLQQYPKNEILMEDIGDNYIRILLQSCLLEEVNEWGKTYYKMHDIVHDFAKSALNQDRYLALNSFECIGEDIKKNTISLRTLFLKSSISNDLLSKFECLHVLKLSGKDVKELTASIGKLIHLRFLDISNSGIIILPESLCKLYNLQTLRIQDSRLKQVLPEQTSNLISLRHLHYYEYYAEFQMPSRMGRLTCLQTLMFFNVGQECGRGIEELGTLKHLKGSLEIRNLELVNGKEGAEEAKLLEKPNLSELTFVWGNKDRESDNCDKNVLEGLQPPQKLRKLKIRNFMGDWFPRWFINLSTLVELKFIDCKRCRELPALGQLPSLESLELSGLENISRIGLSFYGIESVGCGDQVTVMSRKFFPALKYFFLKEMGNLVEWQDTDEVRSTMDVAEVDLFPVLDRLYIEKCSRLTSAPNHFPCIEDLRIRDNCHVSLLKKIVSNITTLSSLKLYDNDEHVESLHLEKRSHSNNLEEDVEFHLRLNGCGGIPSEMLERLFHIPGLRDLKFEFLSNLTRLSIWGNKSFIFTSLETLAIACCIGLTSLPMLESFASLRKLEIAHCYGLTSLPKLESCASLQELEISGCYGLTNLPMLESCASLQNLKISLCHGLTTLPMLESCASLQELDINFCHGLTTLPMLGSCATLWMLKVYECPNLVSFPHDLRQTPSLEILYVFICPKLMIANMPKGFAFLTGLRELKIGPFSIHETNEFDWSGLISSSPSTLTSLRFYGLPHVESLPEQLQYLTSLTRLNLQDFGIEALPNWIGNLVALERLELLSCVKLRYLPSMAARRRLTNLTVLYFPNCPLVEEMWNSHSSTDSKWPMIPYSGLN